MVINSLSAPPPYVPSATNEPTDEPTNEMSAIESELETATDQERHIHQVEARVQDEGSRPLVPGMNQFLFS